MKASRNLTVKINWILDNIIPPIIRDSYIMMYPIYGLAYGKYTKKLLTYKEKFHLLTKEEYEEYYNIVSKTTLAQRPTDLNKKGVEFILNNINSSMDVLDAGCGRCYVVNKIKNKVNSCTGMDIEEPGRIEGFNFCKGFVENIPFKDNSFDVVLCSHVLEHVINIDDALDELVRVSKSKVIIVLPCQREYKYVADLHVRYFPYEYNIYSMLKRVEDKVHIEIRKLGGDWGITLTKK